MAGSPGGSQPSPLGGDGENAVSPISGDGQVSGPSPIEGDNSAGAESPVNGDQITEPSPLRGDDTASTEFSPLAGDAQADVPLDGDDQTIAASPMKGNSREPAGLSPLDGDESGGASPLDGEKAGLETSPVSGDGQVGRVFSAPVEPLPPFSSAMTEHLSPLSGDGEKPQVGKRKSRRGRAAVVVAAVVVAVAALVVAVQFAPGSEQVATTAAEPSSSAQAPVPSVAASSAAVPTTQPNVPQPSEFDAWASKTSQWLDIPLRAMTGYAQATVTLTKEQPACHLSWVTLAAVGKVASDHGRAQGDHVGTDGVLTKPLGTVEVRDFYGRVVSTANASGPMQLAPAVWSKWQRSASGGKPDPQNIDDAALTAGRALCAGGRDLATDWWNAVSSLQGAPVSLHRILATVNVYGTVGQSGQAPNPAVLSAVDFAIDQIGLPYVWGGNGSGDPDPGFDCSGLTTAAYGSAGVKLMRTADTQFHSVAHVSEPQLGDLIFYGEPTTKIHHVGLYIGNQQMIDAPQTGQAVQVHPYRKPGDDYAGAGRPTA